MNKLILQIGLCVFILLISNVEMNAQIPTKKITLQEVLTLAGGSNLKAQELQQRYEIAIAEQKAAKNWWLPELYAGVMLHQLNGYAMNSDGRFFTEVDRQNFWGGAGLTLDMDLGQGIYQKQALGAKADAMRFQTQASKNDYILQAVKKYFDLQAEQLTLAALTEMETQSENIVRQLEVQTEAGITYKSDLLLAKSNLNHSKIALKNSEQELLILSAELKNLLYIKEDVLLVAGEELAPINLVEDINNLTANYDNHPTYKGIQYQIQAIEKEQNTVGKGLLLPNLRLSLSDAAFGDIFSATGSDFEPIDALQNTFDFTGALMWKIPLNQVIGSGDKEIFAAKALLQQNLANQVKDQLACESQVAIAAIKSAEEQREIAEEGLQFAKEALDQSIARQKLRTAEPYQVFQAQEYFMRSRIDYIEAIKRYNQAQYRLYVAMGNNL